MTNISKYIDRTQLEVKTYKYQNYFLVLDRTEVNLNNPGDGTPAMIYRVDHNNDIICSGTYWCVMDEEMEDGQELGKKVYDYFDKLLPEIEDFLYNN
jgi:hypothetical protein